MKTAVHPKFGEGTVVEEREDSGARVLTIDFPHHGRKRLRAEFVEVRGAPAAAAHPRNPALEEAIRSLPAGLDPAPAYRTYGTWLAEQGDAHARLIAFQNDPPERGNVDSYEHDAKVQRAELALVRDVSVLGPLAAGVHSGQLTCKFEHGFVAHAELGPADAPALASLVELLGTARHIAFVRSVVLRANPDTTLSPLWDALARHGLPDTVRTLQLPSPEADLVRLLPGLSRVTTLHLEKAREVPAFALHALEHLTLEEPSATVVRALARCELPNLRGLRIVAGVLDSGVLPALVDDAARWSAVEIVVVAKGIATLRSVAEVEAQERAVQGALSRVTLVIDLYLRNVLASAKRPRDHAAPTSVEAAFLGEDFPIPGHEPPSTDDPTE